MQHDAACRGTAPRTRDPCTRRLRTNRRASTRRAQACSCRDIFSVRESLDRDHASSSQGPTRRHHRSHRDRRLRATTGKYPPAQTSPWHHSISRCPWRCSKHPDRCRRQQLPRHRPSPRHRHRSHRCCNTDPTCACHSHDVTTTHGSRVGRRRIRFCERRQDPRGTSHRTP